MVDYTIAIINIDLTINKMMFRLKLEDLSDRKREGIETIIKDLKHASEVIKTLNNAIDDEHKKNTNLYLENRRLQSVIEQLLAEKQFGL